MVDVSRRNFNKALAFGSLSAVMLAAAGCTPGTSTTGAGSTGTTPQTLTLGLDLDFGSFDPSKVQSGGSVLQVWQSVFDTLLRLDTDGTVLPNLAESYEFNDEHTELVMTIRKDVKFTDGAVVDANAAKVSLENMKNGSGSDASRLADVTITAPDDRTVVLTSSVPNGLLPTFMCLAPGIVASPASLTAADRDQKPVGSGPYTLDAAATTSGATYSFIRNPDYWNKDAYPFEKVVFKSLIDISARVNALKSGQINGAPATSATATELRSSGVTLMETRPAWAGLFIGDRNGTVIPALGQVKVRQAINMVFDRPAILEALFQGAGTVTNQIFNEQSEAFLPDMVDRYPYDVNTAKSLMAESGYESGFDLKIPALAGFDIANPLITQQLGLLGIRVTQETLSGPQAIFELLSGKYPIFYFPLESRTALWDIVQGIAPAAIWNVNKAQDPALTPLIEKAQTLEGSEAKANAQAINKFLIEQAWFCPWVYPESYYGTDKGTSAQPVIGSAVPYLHSITPAA